MIEIAPICRLGARARPCALAGRPVRTSPRTAPALAERNGRPTAGTRPPEPIRSPQMATTPPSRSSRTCAARLAPFVALLAGLLPAGAASGAEPPAGRAARCRASIEVSSSAILAGESVTVTGAVQCQEGGEADGQAVTLLAHTPGGGAGFTEVGTTTSEAGGSYEITSPSLDENTIDR